MTKSIFKEIIIILLLILAIILILGVLLYEYIPSNKIIPEQITYTTSESVKSELEAKDDLEYVPGKSNPFAPIKKDVVAEGNNEVNEDTNSIQNPETPSNSENNEKNNSTVYVPDKGTK